MLIAFCSLHKFKYGTDEKPGQKVYRLYQIDCSINHFKLVILFLFFLPLYSEFQNTAPRLYLYIFYSNTFTLSFHSEPDGPAILLRNFPCICQPAFNMLHELCQLAVIQLMKDGAPCSFKEIMAQTADIAVRLPYFP